MRDNYLRSKLHPYQVFALGTEVAYDKKNNRSQYDILELTLDSVCLVCACDGVGGRVSVSEFLQN